MTNIAFILELDSYTFLDIIGEDCDRFLQGQLTINVDSTKPNEAILASICNPKGRVVSLFHIEKIENGYRLYLPKNISQITIDHLAKYSVFYKVTIEEYHASHNLIAISGLSKQKMDSFVTEKNIGSWTKIATTNLIIVYPSNDTNALNTARTWSKSLNIELKAQDKEWYWLLAENGIPWLSHNTSEQFLPHNLDLPKLAAVDFNKGCFTGQEVIARMQYKAKLKQHMHLFNCEKRVKLSTKQKLYQGDKAVAEIICEATIDKKGCMVLALLKDSADKSKSFQLDIENSPILKLIE